MRSSLEVEPLGESIAYGFILIHLIAEKEKKLGLTKKKRTGRMVLFSFT